MKPSITSFNSTEISLSRAALIAGISLFIMLLTTPFAEFSIFPELIDHKAPLKTAENIINNKKLFSLAIFLILITLIADIVAAWALYIFLKPVNKSLSLLTAWFRLIYAAIYLIALFNLIEILGIIRSIEFINHTEMGQIHETIFMNIKAFRVEASFCLIFFGLYLILLSYLVFKASYIPKIFGVILAISGLSWIIDNLSHFFFPEINTKFLFILVFGELIFMLWLLIKGSRIKKVQ